MCEPCSKPPKALTRSSTDRSGLLDHGLGVESLYAHLSSIGVKVGDSVTKGQELGRTGSTGLAGGDHLHFRMLMQGTTVKPVEWWDQNWLPDRVN